MLFKTIKEVNKYATQGFVEFDDVKDLEKQVLLTIIATYESHKRHWWYRLGKFLRVI
jgi:hypothetical protein